MLISIVSDHILHFIGLDYVQTVNNVPKFIQIKQHSPESTETFKTELTNSDIYDKLNKDVYADPSDNFYLLEEIIT